MQFALLTTFTAVMQRKGFGGASRRLAQRGWLGQTPPAEELGTAGLPSRGSALPHLKDEICNWRRIPVLCGNSRQNIVAYCALTQSSAEELIV